MIAELAPSLSSRTRERASGECPLCGGAPRYAFTVPDLNRAIGRERFEYLRCDSCGCYFLAEVPLDMSAYYPREYYELPTAEQLDRLAASQGFAVGLLLGQIDVGRLVEVGPGEGVFARAARNAGFEVTAIEMDPRACEHLRDVVGVRAIDSAAPEQVIPTLPPSRAIVMWHVIEHLRRPWEVLEVVAANLEVGGVLAIATPNPRALQFRLLGRRWAHVDAPRHLFLIGADSLEGRCAELGLQLASTSTDDPAGRHWNRFGWEYALRRPPRSRPATRVNSALSAVITRALRPLEARDRSGCAYTSIFVKTSGS